MSEKELIAFKTRIAKEYPAYWELADYVLILEQERNNYKELYEKENKNWNEIKEWIEEEKPTDDMNENFIMIRLSDLKEKMQEIEKGCTR